MIPVLFLQVAVVLAACHLLELLAARAHQPPVIAQLVAGVVIGPSVLGLVPGVEHALFAPATLGPIQALGQIGVALYMFTVGAGLDLGVVRRTVRTGLAVTVSGTLVPLVAGGLVAWPLIRSPGFVAGGTPAAVASLFLAVSMAVTAFPVMARIISDRGLLDAPLASVSLACGAISDAVAWCLLALVVAFAAGRPEATIGTLGGTIALAVALLLCARPLIARLARPGPALAAGSGFDSVVLLLLMVVAGSGDVIGVHPVFGAFLLGAVMPRGELTRRLCERIGPITSELLLPLFFAYAGLQTRLGLIDRPSIVLLTAMLILVATLSKGLSCGVAARLTGQSGRDSLAIGVLMNARGLVELVVIGIGLQRHVITPTLYAMLVLMTAVTTFLPSPVLVALYRRGIPAAAGALPDRSTDPSAAGWRGEDRDPIAQES